MNIKFAVNSQIIKRIDDNIPVSDSINYITFEFVFSEEWNGINKTAIISIGNGTPYYVLITDNKISADKLPVFTQGEWGIGVFGGNLITSNKAPLTFVASGLRNGKTPPEPSVDVYNQILSMATEAKETADSVRNDADNGIFDGKAGEIVPEYIALGEQIESDAAEVKINKGIVAGYKSDVEAAKDLIIGKITDAENYKTLAGVSAGTAEIAKNMAIEKAQVASLKADAVFKKANEINIKADEVAGNTSTVVLKTTEVINKASEINLKAAEVSKDANEVKVYKDIVIGSLDKKVDKVTGKGLSAEDYTTEEKDKLNSLLVYYLGKKDDFDFIDDIRNYGDYYFNIDGEPYTLRVLDFFGQVGQFLNSSVALKYRTSKSVGWFNWTNISTAFTTLQESKLTNLPTKAQLEALFGDKVDKITGKQLSTEDYTTEEKEKLATVEENANNYVLPEDVVKDSDYAHTDNNFTTALKNKVDGDDGVDGQSIVNVGVNFDINLSINKEIYKIEPPEDQVNFFFYYSNLIGKNYRFEVIVKITTPSFAFVFWDNDNMFDNSPNIPTYFIPPDIKANTINKFVFETFDGGETWYGNQCYSVEVV